MGVVYAAEHVRLGREVALKTMWPGAVLHPPAARRFEREARQVASLRHPGIVKVYDLGVAPDGTPYIEMERLDGVDLGSLLPHGALSVEAALDVAAAALEALDVAHERRVVHRDIKPANIFLARCGQAARVQVKLLDFGLAKALSVGPDATLEVDPVTRPGIVIGTPMHASPEQLRDPRSVDHRTDLYSLGTTLYELLTGEPVVEPRSLAFVIASVLEGRIRRRPSERGVACPPWLDAWLARLLAMRARDRFATASDALGELRRHARCAGRTFEGELFVRASSRSAAQAPARVEEAFCPFDDVSEVTHAGSRACAQPELPLGPAPWPLPGVVAAAERWGIRALRRVLGRWVLVGASSGDDAPDLPLRELWSVRVWPVDLTAARDTLSIGRAQSADVRVDVGAVSRLHATLLLARDVVRLTDAGSRNGTRVAGRAADEPLSLAPGTEIELGPVTLRFERTEDFLAALEPLLRCEGRPSYAAPRCASGSVK
ncbi:MAG: protein kinase [Sandaracinaceae bacterium]|nr:protein kinase [Sandaracinaceae bacterium]